MSQSATDKSKIPQHYWLASAEVYYQQKENPTGVTSATLNVVFTTEEQVIRAKHLASTQQGAQHQLFQRAGKVDIDVVDVVFNSFSYLGFQTPEEFLGEDLKKGLAEGVAAAKAAATGTIQ